MNTPDIGPLVKGIVAIIGIAIATGQYSNLEHWARMQAVAAIAWKEPLPYFFGDPEGRNHHHKTGAHRPYPEGKNNALAR